MRASGTALNGIRERTAACLHSHRLSRREEKIRVRCVTHVYSYTHIWSRARICTCTRRIHATQSGAAMRPESRPVNRATHYHKCPRAGDRPTRKSVSQIARVGLCHLPTSLCLSRASPDTTVSLGADATPGQLHGTEPSFDRSPSSTSSLRNRDPSSIGGSFSMRSYNNVQSLETSSVF